MSGNAALAANTGLSVNAVSNTVIPGSTGTTSGIAQGLVVAGTNIDTWVSGVQETSDAYVATFASISSGTSTTTGAVTAVLTNRTGW